MKLICLVALLALAGCTAKDIASVDGMESAITGQKVLDPVAMDAAPVSIAQTAVVVAAPVDAAPACVPAFRMPCPGGDE